MNAEDFNDWQDEDDESEEDFVPEAYDEEDDDSDDDSDDGDGDDDNDGDDLPTFLQGDLIMDRAKGLCYQNDGNFSLVSQNSTFTIGTPLLDSPIVFAGWIKDPSVWIEFEVYFSKQLMSTCTDPLEMKLLEAQEKELAVAGIDDNKESLLAKKSGNDTLDDKWMEGKKTPAKGNLKAPPAYSLIDNGDNVKETIGCGKTNAAEKAFRDDSVFVVSGTQIDNNKKNFRKIEFRGLYRPSSASIKRLHLICSIQANDGEASSAAMTSGAVAATSVAAAASKKRNRSNVDDDDSIGATGGVAYQELFALHDDSRLSTEDLRRKYYGSGDRNEEDTNTKKRASKGTCNTSSKGCNMVNVERGEDINSKKHQL